MAPGGGSSVEVRGLTWRPAARRQPVLRDLDLTVRPGERVLLAGPSGAGKSTLLRAIAGLLLTADVGDLSGDVRVGGEPPQEVPGRVGLLLQDPTAAVVAERVGRDVAFGLENLRTPRAEIWPRVRRALDSVGFPYDVEHLTSALSGGESQRLALAGALALTPGLLLLDEPTSMLDDTAAGAVRQAILDVAEERHSTVVVVEHRLEPWLDHVDRLVVMSGHGVVVADGDPHAILADRGASLASDGVWVPGLPDPAPVEVPAELVAPLRPVDGGRPLVTAREVVVRLRSLLARRASTTVALDGVEADLDSGSVVAVTGPSGAGKSTLVSVLAGLQRPDEGRVEAAPHLTPPTAKGRAPWAWRSTELAARISWVPQQPEHGVVARTVRDELLVAPRALGLDAEQVEPRVAGLLVALGLDALAGASPYHLSGGEQRRLMLAAALVHGPNGVLLDEPTVGQDRNTWATVVGACRAVASAGGGVAMATHDRAAVRAAGGRELRLCRGRIG